MSEGETRRTDPDPSGRNGNLYDQDLFRAVREAAEPLATGTETRVSHIEVI